MKMQLRNLLAGFMSVVMTLSAISLPTTVAATTTEKVKWKGYASNAGRSVDFDIWDGSYDTDWQNAAGTSDAPYIIDSAADLMSISKISDSFDGKYFRLDADIDTGANNDILFQNGMGADFDLNGHVIRTGADILIGDIAETGKLFNGTLVSTGEIKGAIDTGNSSKTVTMVADNYGSIDNVLFMSNQVFLYDNDDTSANVKLANRNYGIISDCTGYVGLRDSVVLVSLNDTDANILNCAEITVACPWSTTTYRSSYNAYFIAQNDGLIKDCIFDTDSNSGEKCSWEQSFGMIDINNGTIDTISICDVTIYDGNHFILINQNSNIVQNLDIRNLKLNSDGAIIYTNTGILQNSVIDIKTYSNHEAFVIHYSNFGYNQGVLTSSYMNPLELTLRNVGIVDENYDYISYFNNMKYVTYNCKINIEYLPSELEDIKYSTLFPGCWVSCDINVTGLSRKQETHTSGQELFHGVIVDCNIYLDEVKTLGALQDGGELYCDIIKSNIHIGKITRNKHTTFNSVSIKNVYWSTVTVDEIEDYGFGSAYTSLCMNAFGSDIIIKKAMGAAGDFVSECTSYNTRYFVTYGGAVTAASSHYGGSGQPLVSDCELYYFFDSGTTGNIGAFMKWRDRAYIIDHTLIYIDEMPDGVHLTDNSVIKQYGGYNANTGRFDIYEGMTVIAPRINISNAVDPFFVIDTVTDENAAQDYYIDVGLYFEDAADIKYVAGTSPLSIFSSDAELKDNVFNINVFDANGSDLNIPVYGLMTESFGSLKTDNFILRSNTTSEKSSLVYLDNGNNMLTNISGGNSTVSLEDCILDLPNTNKYDPDTATSGEYAGFVYSNNWLFNGKSDEAGVLVGVMQRLGLIDVSDSYVIDGHSYAYTDLSSDPELNTFTILDALSENDVVKAMLDNGLSLRSEDDCAEQDIKYYGENGDVSGELAYLLDNGSAGNTSGRTYNWTVADDTCCIKNPFTGEAIYYLSPKTLNRDAYICKYLSSEANLNPVFKASVRASENGYIELEGIGNTHTQENTDDFLYAKSEAYIVSKEITGENARFYSATEQIGDGTPTAIPNTPRAAMRVDDGAGNYTIKGYTQPYDDVIITPLFVVDDTSKPETSEPVVPDDTSKPKPSKPSVFDPDTSNPETSEQEIPTVPKEPDSSDIVISEPDGSGEPTNPNTGLRTLSLLGVFAAAGVFISLRKRNGKGRL